MSANLAGARTTVSPITARATACSTTSPSPRDWRSATAANGAPTRSPSSTATCIRERHRGDFSRRPVGLHALRCTAQATSRSARRPATSTSSLPTARGCRVSRRGSARQSTRRCSRAAAGAGVLSGRRRSILKAIGSAAEADDRGAARARPDGYRSLRRDLPSPPAWGAATARTSTSSPRFTPTRSGSSVVPLLLSDADVARRARHGGPDRRHAGGADRVLRRRGAAAVAHRAADWRRAGLLRRDARGGPGPSCDGRQAGDGVREQRRAQPAQPSRHHRAARSRDCRCAASDRRRQLHHRSPHRRGIRGRDTAAGSPGRWRAGADRLRRAGRQPYSTHWRGCGR